MHEPYLWDCGGSEESISKSQLLQWLQSSRSCAEWLPCCIIAKGLHTVGMAAIQWMPCIVLLEYKVFSNWIRWRGGVVMYPMLLLYSRAASQHGTRKTAKMTAVVLLRFSSNFMGMFQARPMFLCNANQIKYLEFRFKYWLYVTRQLN